MNRLVLFTVALFLSLATVQAQTLGYGYTRKRILHPSNVLRKSAKPQPNRYHPKESTRTSLAPRHSLSLNASRAQPMVTKPYIPISSQP